MAGGGNAVLISIASEFDSKGIREAQKQLAALEKNIPANQLNKLGQGIKNIGTGMSRLGGSLTKNLTLPLAAAGGAIFLATQRASDLNESITKTEAVFGSSADEIMAWSKTSATALGQSQQQALEAASTYGNLFQAFGLTREQAVGMSMDVTELAADLASFNNVSVDDAILALRSGLSGETEPLKRFGIALNDQRLRLEASRLGLGEYAGTLPVAVKAQAAYSLILKDSTLAQGDFARTSDGLANQQRILKAEVDNAVASFGEAFLPILLTLVSVVRERLIPIIQSLADRFKSLTEGQRQAIVVIGALLAALGPALLIFGKMTSAIGGLIISMSKLDAAMLKTRAASIAAFVTNPAFLVIGAIVLSIAGLVAIFTKAYKESEILREAVSEAFNMIKNAISSAIKIVRDALERNSETVGKLQVSFKALGDFIGKFIVPIFATFLSSAIESTAKVISGAIQLIGGGVQIVASFINNAISYTQNVINLFIKGYNAVGSVIAKIRNEAFTPLAEVTMPRLAFVTGEATRQTKEFRDSQEYAGKTAAAAAPAITDAADATEKMGGSAKKAAKEVNKSFDEIKKALIGLVGDLKSFGAAGGGFDVVGLEMVEGIINGLKAGKKKISDTAKSAILEAIDQVKTTVREASDFAKSVSDTIFGWLSISDAFDSFTKRQTDATEALQKLRDFQADLGEEATESQLRQLAKLQDEYHKAQEAAANGSQNVVEEFIQQAERFKEFGEKMRRLLALGLNQQSFMDIMRMGAERGGQVADAYLNGNTAELIARTNATVSEYRKFADTVGMESAQTFFQTGIASAIQMLSGLIQELLPKGKLRNQLMRVMDNLAQSLNRTAKVTVGVEYVGGGGGGGAPVISGDISPGFIPSPFDPNVPIVDIGPGFFEGIFNAATPFARGGIVTAPTIGLVGEAGPEAVIPLSRAGSMMGNTYNINVNVPVTSDPSETGRQIVEAIKTYERRSGRVFASV